MKRHLWLKSQGRTMRCARPGCKAVRRPKYENKSGSESKNYEYRRPPASWEPQPAPPCTGDSTSNQ